MRTRWVVLLLSFMVVSAISAFAGPTIQIGDPSCSTWNTANGPLINIDTSNVFSVTTNDVGGGYFGLCNLTGVLVTKVDIKFLTNTLTPDEIGCTSTVFGECIESKIPGGIELLFDQPPNSNCVGDACGIPKNQLMTINLNTLGCVPTGPGTCNDNSGGWPDGLTMYGGTNQEAVIPVPEPTSIALVSLGLIALRQHRRRRR